MTEIVQIKDCPRCREKHGWYEKRIQWGEQYYSAAGHGLYFCDTNGRGGRQKFCPECNRNITRCISDGRQYGGPKPSKAPGTGDRHWREKIPEASGTGEIVLVTRLPKA